MGDVGIAMSHGAESTLSNPALITSVESSEVSFGGTIFMPDIQTQLNANPQAVAGGMIAPQDKMTSDADINMIPEVSFAMKMFIWELVCGELPVWVLIIARNLVSVILYQQLDKCQTLTW